MSRIFWSDLAEPDYYFHLAVRKYGSRERFGIHDHDFAELALVLEGGGKNICTENQYRLNTGSLFFVLPSTVHSIAAGRGGMTLINMAFRLEYALQMEDRYFPGEPGYFRNAASSGIPMKVEGDRFSRLASVLHEVSGRPRTRFNLDHTLMSVYGIIRSPLIDSSFLGAPDWLKQACLRIQSQGASISGLEDLYLLAGKSREHTARELKKYTGLSPTEFVNGLRLEKAARLLCTTGDSVLQISLECGFENLSWFHRAFKRKYGSTPLQHRKRNQLSNRG